MTTTLAEFQEKFRVPELEVVSSAHWTWSVRPVQTTLGAGILSLKRFATSFGDLSVQEAGDLAGIVSAIEGTLGSFSAPGRMNYLMLMMVDAHVHFHVLPRYGEVRVKAGQEWTDRAWPGPPGMGDDANVGGSGTLLAIRDSLRALAV
jgi:diadenosine tetraphosphate (Ap4A) HIT family hydrolase